MPARSAPPKQAEWIKKPKSEAVAYAWASGGTLALLAAGAGLTANTSAVGTGLLVMAGGLVAGPSLGQYYAGSPAQARVGMAIRGLGLGMVLLGIAQGFELGHCSHLHNLGPADLNCGDENGSILRILGTLTLGSGLVYSLVDTHYAVERHGRRIGRAAFGFSPALALGPEGRLRPGGRAWMSF